MATYRYAVKYNGKYYAAGEEVPEEKAEVKKPTSALLDEEEVIPKKRSGRPKKEQ